MKLLDLHSIRVTKFSSKLNQVFATERDLITCLIAYKVKRSFKESNIDHEGLRNFLIMYSGLYTDSNLAFILSDVVILETSKAGCCLSIKVAKMNEQHCSFSVA